MYIAKILILFVSTIFIGKVFTETRSLYDRTKEVVDLYNECGTKLCFAKYINKLKNGATVHIDVACIIPSDKNECPALEDCIKDKSLEIIELNNINKRQQSYQDDNLFHYRAISR
jgi:hypothetical protein